MSNQDEFMFPLSKNFFHDLNSKLGIIARKVELFRLKKKMAQLGESVSEEYTESFLTSIEENIEKATNIVQEMQKAFNPALELESLNLREVVFRAASEINIPQNVTYTNNILSNSPNILATSHIIEVFRILLFNAVEATENNGNIEINAGQYEENLLEVFVKDNGAGIQHDFHKNIFMPFYTTKKKTKYGTGMFWVKLYLNSIGGDIVLVFSDVGKGSEFKLELQLAR